MEQIIFTTCWKFLGPRDPDSILVNILTYTGISSNECLTPAIGTSGRLPATVFAKTFCFQFTQ